MDFLSALKEKKNAGAVPVIPDIKCYSPKDGDLLRGRDPLVIARILEEAGAPALSVVTEPKEFHGSLDLLRSVCAQAKVPVLRKDFIRDVSDLEETRQAGASAILLMVSCLGEERLTYLYHEALKLGLVPFVETHTPEELAFASSLGAELVGINNRDILRLERDDGDVTHAASLLGQAPEAFLVVESALTGGRDVRTALRAGADAALCGTAIFNADDPAAKYRSMTRPSALKICGIMNEKDADLCIHYLADMLGFVVEYPVDVPWNLTRGRAAELFSHLREGILSREPFRTGAPQLCVVAGGSEEHVLETAHLLRPGCLQLHGQESLQETRQIIRGLHALDIKVIRSIPGNPQLREKMFGRQDPSDIAVLMREAGADVLLFDSRDASNAAAGGGSILSEEASREITAAKQLFKGPVMIGGGITPENISSVMDRFPADCIDVMSGSEDRPGCKSEEKIRALCQKAAPQ